MIAAVMAMALAAQEPPANFPFDPATMAEIQASHIEGNVPAAADFDRFLARDLTAYFIQQGMADAVVSYDLLRREPTQSGMSWPKFYLWVQVSSGGGVRFEGAVRISAIERERFEITDVMPRSDIVTSPQSLGSVFPAALIAEIERRASASGG